MNILYVGNAQGFANSDKYYFIPQKLINGFTRLGHNVYVFNDRDVARHANIFRSQRYGVKAMNEALIETCRNFRPALIVLGHCKNVSNETLAQIRKIVPGVKVIYRNVDPLSSAQNVEDIKQRVGAVDAVFITTAGEALRSFSHKAGGVYFMPNPVDPALEQQRAFDNPAADIDFLFLASYLRDQHDHRADTAEYLLKHQGDLNLYIGGAGTQTARVYGAAYLDLLGRAKMGLCMNKTADYYLYASDRMSQYMACGVLAFIPKGPQFQDIFGSDAFIEFEGDAELLDKIRYYKAHDEERRRIAATGHAKIHTYFHADIICRYMIERAFDRPLSQGYHWPVEGY